MDKIKLLTLVGRVEALSGPDLEVDAEIAIELFDGGADHLDDARDVTHARKVLISHGARAGNYEVVGFSGVSLRYAPAFTASLDAAMSLVPCGDSFTLGQNVHHKYWQASVNYLSDDGEPVSRGGSNATKSPALALVAAALRAIVSSQGDDK